MARRHSHSASASSAAFLGFALLATLACGSDSDDGADDGEDAEATEQAAPPSSRSVPPRDEAPAAIQPEPRVEDEPPANASPSEQDDMPAAPGASASNSTSVPSAPAAVFESCTRSEGSYGTNCDYVYVTMTQTSPERCAQLTIDNCFEGYRRPGLSVDTPLSWQLSSAAIGTSLDECALGVFNPQSSIVLKASGAIRWDDIESTELPTGIVVDVTLQPSRTADDPSSFDVVTSAPLNPARCAD